MPVICTKSVGQVRISNRPNYFIGCPFYSFICNLKADVPTRGQLFRTIFLLFSRETLIDDIWDIFKFLCSAMHNSLSTSVLEISTKF